MATYTPQRTLLRTIVLSPYVQSDFNVAAFSDADLTHLCEVETTGFANSNPQMESDYTYAGKGNSFASESRQIADDSAMEISNRLTAYRASLYLSMLMGKDVFTAGVAGAANTHVHTWLDNGAPAFATNIYAADTTGIQRKWQDMVMNELVLTGNAQGAIMAKLSLLGTGRYTMGAMAAIPAKMTPDYLNSHDAQISLGPIGAPVSIYPRALSWEATFARNAELMRMPGNGLNPAFIANGNPTNKLKLVINADSSADILNYRNNQTPLEIHINVTSGAVSMQISYARVILPKTDLGEQNKYVAYTLDLDEQSILKPVGGEAVTVTVTNTAPAFLQPPV